MEKYLIRNRPNPMQVVAVTTDTVAEVAKLLKADAYTVHHHLKDGDDKVEIRIKVDGRDYVFWGDCGNDVIELPGPDYHGEILEQFRIDHEGFKKAYTIKKI